MWVGELRQGARMYLTRTFQSWIQTPPGCSSRCKEKQRSKERHGADELSLWVCLLELSKAAEDCMHSKTCRPPDALSRTRQRFGVRQSSAAFPSVRWQALTARSLLQQRK